MDQVRHIRAHVLSPRADGSIRFLQDGVVIADDAGRIAMVAPFEHVKVQQPGLAAQLQPPRSIVLPPFFDNHTHVSQFRIRGRFDEGVPTGSPGGRLVGALNRNVFPEETRCADAEFARQIARDFLAESLSHGVIGGSAYMTVHPAACRAALEVLPDSWCAGLVLMDQNCPEDLRTDESSLEEDVLNLYADFGPRLILTDRFAVATSSRLRRHASELAYRYALRMQTHLNEQRAEKRLVEKKLYPAHSSYTHVYDADGLLGLYPILAHCVHMTEPELELVHLRGACIAHCPTSNTLLGSGIMPLDLVIDHEIPYAICTDVAAGASCSILNEIRHFLLIHAGRSRHATPSQALYRTTLGAAEMMMRGKDMGSLDPGKEMTFIEVPIQSDAPAPRSADEAILNGLCATSYQRLASLSSEADVRQALTTLAATGLDAGAESDCLKRLIETAGAEVATRVARVVRAGTTIWKRATS